MMLEQFRQNWIRRFRRHTQADPRGQAIIRARSIYILPTRQGLLLAAVLVVMLIGSVNYGSNLGYLVTFLLGGIWLSTILHTWRNLLGLVVSPLRVAAVFAGEEAAFNLLIDNPSNLDRFGIGMTLPGGRGNISDVPADSSQAFIINLPAPRRGELNIDDVSIYSRYPLGLFYAWTYARLDMHCLVYPQPAAQVEAPLEAVYSQNDSGQHGVGADDFVGLRNFRAGDSPRHIDWKALARERGLYSKQFGGDRIDRFSLDWALLSEPDPEQRLSLLARLILLAEERQMSYALKLPGLTIAHGRDERHKHRCLAALARFEVST